MIDSIELHHRIGGQSEDMESFEQVSIALDHSCNAEVQRCVVATQGGACGRVQMSGLVGDGIPIGVDVGESRRLIHPFREPAGECGAEACRLLCDLWPGHVENIEKERAGDPFFSDGGERGASTMLGQDEGAVAFVQDEVGVAEFLDGLRDGGGGPGETMREGSDGHLFVALLL